MTQRRNSALTDKEVLACAGRFVAAFHCVIQSRCGEESRSLLDRRLAEAARREGFPVLGVRWLYTIAEVLAGSARNSVSSRLARGRNTSPISALQSMKVSCAARLYATIFTGVALVEKNSS